MSNPLVSVVMASYNPGEYLEPSLRSVLGQTYDNLEIIVVDDGSTDGSIERVGDLLADERVRLIRQENRGRSAALNRALEVARGEFYVIQDADDVSQPHRVARLVDVMREGPDLAGVMSGHDLIMGGQVLAPWCRHKDRKECRDDVLRFAMPAHDPTAMYRMSLVGDMRYDTALPYVEAYDYTLRVGERFPMVVLGHCLYSYRVHRASITQRSPRERDRNVREVLRRACERRGLRIEDYYGPDHASSQTRRLRNRDLDNNLAGHFIESVLDLRSRGRVADAIRTGLTCSRFHPTDPHYLKALAYAVLPTPVVTMVRSLKRAGRTPAAG